ncbi:MAG: hypothetical protein EZS28_018070 [Streblomastix strix]|uniref:Uncharacterized protein n=1 Tax=Streblomastix strix TaxID=222440 RepID=A0A5J4VVL0_9EUKA|nr:MAG: hypothetical protein EZS28_018070 [Streblomastix strix]
MMAIDMDNEGQMNDQEEEEEEERIRIGHCRTNNYFLYAAAMITGGQNISIADVSTQAVRVHICDVECHRISLAILNLNRTNMYLATPDIIGREMGNS